MNLIYNSEQYCVLEFLSCDTNDLLQVGGFEIMDKSCKRETYLEGSLAENFRRSVSTLIESEPDTDEIDDFLSQYDSLMTQPMTLH
jgi:hypothetical protein